MRMNHNDQREEVEEQLKALGYIDPGAGSSMWQVMLAGFFKFSARIKALFGGKRTEED